MGKKRVFIDMDGTLAQFRGEIGSFETLYREGYYATLTPHMHVVTLAAMIAALDGDTTELYVLSAVLEDSAYAKAEKNAWLDLYLPEIDEKHRIFMPCGMDKAEFVPGGITKDDFLLDDYNKNLNEWEAAGGTGIKLLNGINHTRGTWNGSCLNYLEKPGIMHMALRDVLSGKQVFQHTPPRRDRIKTLQTDGLLYALDFTIRQCREWLAGAAEKEKLEERVADAEEFWENITGREYPSLAEGNVYEPPGWTPGWSDERGKELVRIFLPEKEEHDRDDR